MEAKHASEGGDAKTGGSITRTMDIPFVFGELLYGVVPNIHVYRWSSTPNQYQRGNPISKIVSN